MKKTLLKIKKNPMLYLFLVLALIFLPMRLVAPAESDTKAIANVVGIDKENEEFTISAMVFVPKPDSGFVENYKVISARGDSLAEAFNNAARHIGKQVALSHTAVVVINQAVADGNLISNLDYLVRTVGLSNNTMILSTDDKAMDIVSAIHQLEKNNSLKIDEILNYNDDSLYAKSTTIEDIYEGYYGPCKVSYIANIELGNDPTKGIIVTTDEPGQIKNQSGGEGESSGETSESGSSSGEGGGESGEGGEGGEGGGSSGGGGGSSKKEEKILTNSGTVTVYKKGGQTFTMTQNQVEGANWIYTRVTKGLLKLKSVKTDFDDNVELAYYIRDKKMKTRSTYVNGRPVLTYDIKLVLHLEQIYLKGGKSIKQDIIYSDNLLTEETKQAIETLIKKQFASSLYALREVNADYNNIYGTLMRQHPKKFQKFLETIREGESFLDYVKIDMKITSRAV